ncbi:MAG: hypothetical protein P2A85_09125 [Microcoleus anatoxicus]|uniref:hypothetical protein n=1 Tax=Microcoleus anatoxicus TaxID=2705319 RepID=UPI00366ADE39
MNPRLERILTVSVDESAADKAVLVKEFIESRHTILEYAFFFQWLASELSKKDLEFTSLVYSLTSLDMPRSRLLSIWLLKVVDFTPLNKGININLQV